MKIFLKVIGTVMVALFFTACGGGGGGTDTTATSNDNTYSAVDVTNLGVEVSDGTNELLSITIEAKEGPISDPYYVALGLEPQLVLYGSYSSIATPNAQISEPVTWKTSDPTVATVDSNGLIKAVSKGEVLIEATYEGMTTEINLMITPAYVKEIILTPSEKTITINVSDILELTAKGLMTDGTIVPIHAAWESSNWAIAMVRSYTITGTNRTGGMVEGYEPGTVTIKASYTQNGDGYYVPTAYGEVTVIVE